MFTEEKNVNEAEPKTTIEGLDVEIDPSILTVDEEPVPEPKKGEPEGEPSDDDPYTGKSRDDLVKMLKDSQSHIGKLSNEIGNKRKKQNGLKKLQEEKTETQSEVDKLKKKLETDFDSEYDKDDEEYQRLAKKIKAKESRLSELSDRESQEKISDSVAKELSSQFNAGFLVEQKKALAEQLGLDKLEDDLWSEVSELAQEIAGKGEKLSEEDVHSAAIKTIGKAGYTKLVSAVAQQKVRADIATATGKTVTALTGKTAASARLEDLNEAQMSKLMDHLYKTDYDAYVRLTEKIRTQ